MDLFTSHVGHQHSLRTLFRCRGSRLDGDCRRQRSLCSLTEGSSVLSFAVRCVVLLILSAMPGDVTFGQVGDRPVAVVNGRSISEKEVETLVVAQTLPLEEKLYAIRKAALENLVTTRVLEIE